MPAPFNPLQAIGMLVHHRPGRGDVGFIGTCFAFRRPDRLLTARHCLGDLPNSDVVAVLPGVWTRVGIAAITRHDSADIAILSTEADHRLPMPFWDFVSNFELGEEFFAFGYPEDTFGPSRGGVTPRLFKGYYQRYMTYHSPVSNCSYNAGEMSIGAPPGISGGPVFRPGALPMVTGMVTENLEATTFLDEVEEVERAGTIVERRMHRKVINYGVALLLDSHGEWLADNGVVRPPR